MGSKLKVGVGILVIAIISILTFTLWKTAKQGIDDILLMFGISNVYLSALIIIIAGVSILFILSLIFRKVNFFDAVKDVFKL